MTDRNQNAVLPKYSDFFASRPVPKTRLAARCPDIPTMEGMRQTTRHYRAHHQSRRYSFPFEMQDFPHCWDRKRRKALGQFRSAVAVENLLGECAATDPSRSVLNDDQEVAYESEVTQCRVGIKDVLCLPKGRRYGLKGSLR